MRLVRQQGYKEHQGTGTKCWHKQGVIGAGTVWQPVDRFKVLMISMEQSDKLLSCRGIFMIVVMFTDCPSVKISSSHYYQAQTFKVARQT